MQSLSGTQLLRPMSPSDVWLNESRIHRLRATIGPAVPTLLISGLLDTILETWLKVELAQEQIDFEPIQTLAMTSVDLETGNDGKRILPSTDELRQLKQMLEEANMSWAYSKWKHNLESIFLVAKEDVDKVSCHLARISDHDLAFEAYHRLKSGEVDYRSLSNALSASPKQIQVSHFENTYIFKLPYGIGPLLRGISPGRLIPPCRLGSKVALIHLTSYTPALFDEETKHVLLRRELKLWLQETAKEALTHLL